MEFASNKGNGKRLSAEEYFMRGIAARGQGYEGIAADAFMLGAKVSTSQKERIRCLEEALVSAERSGDKEKANELGIIFKLEGAFSEDKVNEIVHEESARIERSKATDFRVISSMIEEAAVVFESGNSFEAQRLFGEALKYASDNHEARKMVENKIVSVYEDEGEQLHERGAYERSEYSLMMAQEHASKFGLKEVEKEICFKRMVFASEEADMLKAAGDMEGWANKHIKMIDIVLSGNLVQYINEVRSMAVGSSEEYARMLYQSNRFVESELAFGRAASICEDMGDNARRKVNLESMASVLEAHGDSMRMNGNNDYGALYKYRQAETVAHSIGADKLEKRIHEKLVSVESGKIEHNQ
jgi:tetratricopeptide (TPR) repeat protein